MTSPKWLIPISDGSSPIEITIRSERVVPLREPCVFVDMKIRLLTSLEACQFGMAMQEASRVCGEMRAKQEGRKR